MNLKGVVGVVEIAPSDIILMDTYGISNFTNHFIEEKCKKLDRFTKGNNLT